MVVVSLHQAYSRRRAASGRIPDAEKAYVREHLQDLGCWVDGV
jgi:hypothetical protein